MTAPKVSVIVVSHGRPVWLSRCLTAIGQLDYPLFEVVVAADAEGLQEVARHACAPKVKRVFCEIPNISETRNAAIEASTGDILAFVDDDAVPEPLWLRHHVSSLAATGAAASLGYVRGRNGISFQSRAVSIDGDGKSHDAPVEGDSPRIPRLQTGRALKLIGTNFAVRRDAMYAVKGFDPSFRFYLDDSDFAIRLAKEGFSAAVTPLAEVHHGMAPSIHRTRHRFPKRLRDIARSTAIFAQKHSVTSPDGLFSEAFDEQKARLERHLVQGTCEPRDVRHALVDFRLGWEEGCRDGPSEHRPLKSQSVEFKRFLPEQAGNSTVSSRFVGRDSGRRKAAEIVSSGQRATHISLSVTTLKHRVRFTDDGFWEQTGGLFGPSVRTQPWLRWCRFANRVSEELRRVEMQRGIGKNDGVWGV